MGAPVTQVLLPALILIPLLSAAVVGYFRNTWSKTTVSWVACGSVFATFLITLSLIIAFLGDGQPITAPLTTWGPILPRFGLLADSLSLWWMLVVTGCGFLIHVYSTGYMQDDESYGRFMAKLNFFIFAMSLLVLSDNFAGLLMGWANVGLASYMLIGFYIKKPEAGSASMKAFIMNMIGEVGMIAGIAYIFATFGSFSYDKVFAEIAAGTGAEVLPLIGILLLVGAVAKSAQVPLQTWLPNAMEGPTPVSALIHAATMVTAGVYLVSRAWPIYNAAPEAAAAVAWVGAISALLGALMAAGQNDIKRVLAFSTMSQIGYMFLGNGLGAYVAADFHFLTHAFFKAALFLTAGIIVHHYHGDQDIRRMGGLITKDKFAAAVFGAGALALIGMFPFAGFFSKDEILLAAYHHDKTLFVIGIIAAGLTAFYNVRLYSLVFLGAAWTPQAKAFGKRGMHRTELHAVHHDHGHQTPGSMKWPVAILGVLSVVSGWIFFPHWQLTFLKGAYEGLTMEPESTNLVVAGLATGIALIGAGLAYYLYGPKGVRRVSERDQNAPAGALLNMLYFDVAYDFLVVQPTKAVAQFCAHVADAKVIDGSLGGLGNLAVAVGAALRDLHSGYIRRYALSVFGGAVLMLAYYLLV